ncbi:MAG: low molecular weight protein arginine phosphatase [Armatimonadota bacterium]|jgi:protein-tyrosine-phosphatase
MISVLFVCTGNACRSPMAEAFLNHMAGHNGQQAEAFSAGLCPFGDAATRETVAAAAEWDVDVSQHQPQPMTDELAQDADVILAMTGMHAAIIETEFLPARGKTFTLLEFIGESGDVPDPFNHPMHVYRECAEQLWQAVGDALDRLPAITASQVD